MRNLIALTTLLAACTDEPGPPIIDERLVGVYGTTNWDSEAVGCRPPADWIPRPSSVKVEIDGTVTWRPNDIVHHGLMDDRRALSMIVLEETEDGVTRNDYWIHRADDSSAQWTTLSWRIDGRLVSCGFQIVPR